MRLEKMLPIAYCLLSLACCLSVFEQQTANSQELTIDSQEATAIRVLVLPLVETTLSGEIPARIEKIRVDVGERFKAGQELVVFDCEIYRAQLQKAKAEWEEARKTFEVNQRLDALRSVSELEMTVSESRMARAKAETLLREVQVKKCVVKAPFSGRVVKRKANPFEYVSPGQPLLEVIDDVHLMLQLLIPSRWLAQIKKGSHFRVHIDETGRDYKAQVTIVGARIDPVSQTVEIRAEIDGNHSELLAGMSGTAYWEK
jgi:RND family efflux transporter MFP subunit